MPAAIENYFVSPDSPLAGDPAWVGQKACNLQYLSRHGLPVPPWFCLSTRAYQQALVNLKPQLAEMVAGINFTSQESIAAVASAIQSYFLALEWPTEWELPLFSRLKPGTCYAVRSSALGEDSGQDSLAGQLDTFLYVSSYDVSGAISRCWASTFNPRLLAYLHQRGLAAMELEVAVIVQEMIPSQAAGVLFLAHPAGPLNEIVIAAGYGLGEGVVADQVETDTYLFDTLTSEVRRHVHAKHWQVVPAERGGTRLEPVSGAQQFQAVLDEGPIRELVRLGQQVGALYDHPQDIEWSLEPSRGFWILQSRPITTIPRGRRQVFDNSNIVESYPGISSPLTFSHVRPAYEQLFMQAAHRLGVPARLLEEQRLVFQHLLGYIQGRIYYNLTNWYRMFRLFPGTEKYIAVWEEMMGIRAPGQTAQAMPLQRWLESLPALGLILARFAWHFTLLDLSMQRFQQRFHQVSAAFWAQDLEDWGSDALCREYQDLSHRLLTGWEITLFNDGYAFILTALCRSLLTRAGVPSPGELLNDLLCGDEGMESAKPVRALVAMAELVRADENLLGFLQARLAGRLELSPPPAWPQLQALFEAYLAQFGDRSLAELKIESLTFRQQPETLWQLVLDYARSDLTTQGMRQRESRRRQQANQTLRQHMPLPWRLAFQPLLALAQRSLRYRESSRLVRARAFGLVRRIFDTLGKNLTRAGRLPAPGDVYFLTVDELSNDALGTAFQPELAWLARQRRKFAETYCQQHPAPRLILQGPVHQNFIPQQVRDPEPGTGRLQGTGCSAGVVEAEALVVKNPAEAGDVRGKILVAEMTDPGWVFLMLLAAGLIVEKGSLLSHTAIIGRELGIPTIVGVEGATRRIATGQRLRLDGSSGAILLRPDTAPGPEESG